MRQPLTVKPIEISDFPRLDSAFKAANWNKSYSLKHYQVEWQSGTRALWVAASETEIAGFVTVVWTSSYGYFAAQDIPEVKDFNVLPAFRRQGLGNALLHAAEAKVFERSPSLGLGVGLTQEYGNAQRLYWQRGYQPVGRGLTYADQPVSHGDQVTVDDDLVMWLLKTRPLLSS